MLFFIFFLVLLVLSDSLFIGNTTIILFYLLYIGLLTFNYSNVNVVTNLNFKYIFKNFILRLCNSMYLFTLFLYKYFSFYPNDSQLKWKPLFKRSSYFGLYRSTRNQFLNK